MVPEKKITPEDVKYVLSAHYQGTPYDPYLSYGDKSMSGAYRSIGINRNDFMSLIQMRPEGGAAFGTLEWVAYASNAFNTMVPFYADGRDTGISCQTTGEVSTENFYWIQPYDCSDGRCFLWKISVPCGALSGKCPGKSHALINQYDALLADEKDPENRWN